jgi:hypothetical protein
MSTDLNHDQVRVGDERLGVIHSGSRYMLGFGRDYFGIWEQGAPSGGPSQRFPATEQGRAAAWQRYIELEPSAQQVWETQFAPSEEEEEGRKGWTRGRLITVGILGVVVILAVVLLQSNKKSSTGGGGGGGAVGKAAHIDITGGATATEDLTQSSFTFSGFGTLYPQVEVTWKGSSVTLHLLLNVPTLGANTTNENPFRVLDATLQATASASSSPSAVVSASPSGSPAGATTPTKFLSLHGECQIQVTTLEEHGIAGTFDCTGVPAISSSTTTIDAKGTFSAQS